MFCDKCGTKIPENETKCPNCGNVMEPEQELADETTEESILPVTEEVVAEEVVPEVVVEAQEELASVAPDAELLPIQNEVNGIWPDWQIESLIGRGSFGEVYKARRDELGTTIYCAVKIIRIPQNLSELDSIRSEVGLDEQASTTYFKGVVDDCVNEIKLMESLKSAPNIVGIEDYKVVEGPQTGTWIIYIRMELLENFNQYAAKNPLSEKEIVRLGIDICTALESCAVKDVLHRDIKPENIFKSELGGFKLGDFGIARKLESSTVGMSKKGTYNYMAPEVYNGSSEYDARSDIYSLGIVLYKLLNNNRFPFLSANASGLTYKEVLAAMEERMKGTPLPKPVNASEATGSVILAACDADPNNRYVSATAFKNALMQAEAVLNGELTDLDATVGTGSKLGMMAQKATTPAASAIVSSRNVQTPSVKSTQPKKSGKKVLIIALAVLIALGGLAGFIYYQWYNSVEQRALRALDKGDYEEAADILSEDYDVAEKSTIVDNLRAKVSGIREDFSNNKKDYETARMELASIRKIRNKEIEKDLDEAGAFLDRVNESRSIFSSAEHFMEVGDWKNAISRYQEVIEEDKNFDRAKEQLATAISNLRNEGLDNAKVKADQEDYQGAIDILKMTLETLPNDSVLTQQVTIYQTDMATKQKNDILKSAEDYAQQKQYLEAMRVLDGFLEAKPSDADVKAARQNYYDQYVNDALTRAEEQAKVEEYQSAINIVQMALKDFPDEQRLSQKLSNYQASLADKQKRDLLASAEELAQKKQYTAAMNLLDQYLNGNPSDADVKTARQKYYGQYVNDVVAKADSLVAEGKFSEAMTEINTALLNAPDEQKLTVKIVEIKESHIQQILVDSKQKSDSKDYIGAIEILEEGQKYYADESRFINEIARNKEEYISYVSAEADKKVKDKDYSGAETIIKDAIQLMPDETRLKEKLEEIQSKAPISFKSIDALNGGFTWNSGNAIDPFGNVYTQYGDYVVYSAESDWDYYNDDVSGYIDEQIKYREIRIYGKYKTITGMLTPQSSIGNQGWGYIKVYGDGKLLYTSPYVRQKTDAFEFSVDISGVDYLSVYIYVSDYVSKNNGAIILVNPLLHSN